jgi:hypothetical protein
MSETRDFALQVNIRNLGPADVMQDDPSPGPHMVEIIDVRQVTADGEGGNGKTTLRFTLQDIEENSITRGIVTGLVVGTDWSKDFNTQHVVNLLHGIGADPSKVKGVITLTPKALVGRKCPIYVKAPPSEFDENGKRQFSNKNFITPGMYEAAKRSRAGMARIAPQIPAANQPQAAVNGNGGQPTQPFQAPSSSTSSSTMTRPPIAANSPTVIPAANSPSVELGDLFA